MKKINLGYSGKLLNLGFLINDFNLISEPYHLISNGEIIKNYDVFFKFDSKQHVQNNIDFDLYDIPVIGCNRFEKSTQALILNKLNISTPKFFKIPPYIKDESTYYSIMTDIEDEEEIVVKSENGARGIGQALIKKKDFYSICQDSYEISNKYRNEEYIPGPGEKNKDHNDYCLKVGGNEQKEYVFDSLQNGDYFISKKVNVDKEYRMIALYENDPILVERKIKEGEWQANLNNGNEAVFIEDWKKCIPNKLYNQILSLLENLKTPFLSVDIYKTKEGEWGLFEFQMEFGYKALPKKELVHKINNSTKKLIKDLYKI